MRSFFRGRGHDESWFVYLAYNAPHTPIMAPEDRLLKYDHIEDPSRRTFAAMIDSLDDGIGRVLKAVEDQGQESNTLIWFLSDNGAVEANIGLWNGSRNDPFSGAKGDVFEGGIRVPFIVSWEGVITSGQVLDDPASSLDILPTTLAAVGQAHVPAIHAGHNLLPWLSGRASCPNDKLFWSWSGDYNAVRIGCFKEKRNGRASSAVDGTPIPAHNYVDLLANPHELGGEHTLQDASLRQSLSFELDSWLEQVRSDAVVMTPDARGDVPGIVGELE